MEYKRVKPILYDRGVPKYQASGILNLARVVLPRLAGAAGVAGAAAGAKDYTWPSDQELYDFVFGKRWEAPPIEGYVNYPNYDEIIESQRSDEPIGTIYMPETHKTSASIPTYARPIPVSYADQYVVQSDTIHPGDTTVVKGKKYVLDKDVKGNEYFREVTTTTPNPENGREPDDDDENERGLIPKFFDKVIGTKATNAIGKKITLKNAIITALVGGLYTGDTGKTVGKAVSNNVKGFKEGLEGTSAADTTTTINTTTPTTSTTSEESFVPRDSLIARRKRRYEKEGL